MNAVIDSLPGFEFVWQFVTAGALVGSVVAYRRRRTRPRLDPFDLVVRWSLGGLAIGVASLVLIEVAQ